jgi:hypothetical protein
VSGHDRALCRCACHEAQRTRRIGRLELVDEREWLDSLDDRELGRVVRGLNSVDRAVDGYHRLLDEDAA